MTKVSTRVFAAAIAAWAVLGSSAPAISAERPRVVVELFTSQGCSSCPPANANLIRLSRRADVLTLSFAVTYWDYLGWKDTFGRPEFTERQASYEQPLGQEGPFTPQMVFNGRQSAVGNDLGEIRDIVDRAAGLDGPPIELGRALLRIGADNNAAGDADVWLVSYDPRQVAVPVDRGENTGATLAHTHVVHALTRLGGWSGKAATFALPPAVSGLKSAILLQAEHGGPILAAITD